MFDEIPFFSDGQVFFIMTWYDSFEKRMDIAEFSTPI